MNLNRWLLDTGERVVFTWLAALMAWLPLSSQFESGWVGAMVVATVPPVLSIVMNAVPFLRYEGPSWLLDVVVRASKSILQAAGSVLAADGANLADGSLWMAAAVAGVMALFAFAKGYFAQRVAHTITPASLAQT